MSSILSPRGTSMIELGGDRAWLQRTKGDIAISYEWLDVGKSEPSACMCLWPTVLKLDGGAYAIPQDNAYEYVDNRGRPTQFLLVAAYNAACTMGFFPDQATVFRIIDIIVDGIADLVRMPSEQPSSLNVEHPVLGIEARAKVDGQVVHEEVL